MKERKSQKPIFLVKARLTCYIKSFSIFDSVLEVKFYTPEQPWLILLPAVPWFLYFFTGVSVALLNSSWGRPMKSPIFHYSIWSKNFISMLVSLWNQWSLSPLKRYLTKWEIARGKMTGKPFYHTNVYPKSRCKNMMDNRGKTVWQRP